VKEKGRGGREWGGGTVAAGDKQLGTTVQQETGSNRLYVYCVVNSSVATLLQQEKNNSVDVQQSRVNFTGFICTVAREPSR
jgi:hypothetical protein